MDSERPVIPHYMRLISVDIANYRIIRSAQIDLPDQIIGVIGPNGSGKSTIVEAISWALYGHQVARSGKEEIKATFARPSDDCKVDLSFEIKGERYRVIRRLVGKSEKSEVELFRADSTESIGIAETRGSIENLLGLDWRGFLTSFLARQQELNALTELAPAKRREHLAGMLGIERLDQAVLKARESAKEHEQKIALLTDQLASRAALESELVDLREHHARLRTEAERQTGASSAAAQRLADRTNVLREQQEREAACSRYENELMSLEQSRQFLSENRAKIAGELAGLLADQATIGGLESRLILLDSVRAELEQLRLAQSRLASKAQFQAQLDLQSKEVAAIATRRDLLAAETNSIEQLLSNLPSDLDLHAASAKSKLAELRDHQIRTKSRRESLAKDLAKLAAQFSSIDQLDANSRCDRCLRPLSVHDLDQVRQHLTDEKSTVQTELDQVDRELAQIAEQTGALGSTSSDLDHQLAARTDLTSKRHTIETEQASLSDNLAGAEQQSRFLADQLSHLGEMPFDLSRFDALQSEHAELEQINTQFHQLRDRLTRLDPIKSDLADLDQKLADINARSSTLRREIEAIGFNRAQLDQAAANWQRAQQEADSARAESIRLDHALDLAAQDLKNKEDRIRDFERAASELEASRRAQYQAELLARLFADFRKEIIAKIRPRLADLASSLLADMTENRYTMVELDEDYNLAVNDLGQFFGVDRFSGGESDLANLCLRLAISQALTESAGLDRSFVILDEVFGSQDESRRDLVFQGLAKLKSRFPQMLLITHFEELKQKVEMLIEMVPTRHGWSEVRINGKIA